MVKRVAGRTAAIVGAAGVALAGARAQMPALGDAKHVVLEVVTVQPGKQVPRVPAAERGEKACTAFALDGRKLAWRVGNDTVETELDLRRMLHRVSTDPDASRPHPDRAGERVPLPLRLKIGDDARCADVVASVDAARAVGFDEIHLIGARAFEPRFEPAVVAQPVVDGGATVVPRAIFQRPDDVELNWRPVLRVDQRGRVTFEGAIVSDPAKPDSGKTLRAALERCARVDLDDFGTRRFGPQQIELSNNCVLIHADKWTPWSAVRALAQAATDVRPALYQLQFAVGEQDCEARVRAGERFPAAKPRPADAGKR